MSAQRCSGCHALEINKQGPRLLGVYGRKAASLPDFGYSASLWKLNVKWDERRLDRWLTGADAPDTEIAFQIRLKMSESRSSRI